MFYLLILKFIESLNFAEIDRKEAGFDLASGKGRSLILIAP